jgi:hypothetical protein
VRNAYRVLDRKPERSRPLGRPKCGWKDILRQIKTNLGGFLLGIALG